MICYLLNKYNANKTIEFTEDSLDRLIGPVLDPKNRVTIEILHDPDGPMEGTDWPVEGKSWHEQWDGHWGKVKREIQNVNLDEDKKLTYTIPPLSFVSFKFEYQFADPSKCGWSLTSGLEGHYSGMI